MRFSQSALAAAPVVGLLALAALGAHASATPPLVLNESSSLPRGLYVRIADRPVRLGEVVAAPQPEAAKVYLDRLGMPAGVRLLKRVAALPGDRVCAEPQALVTPARRVPLLRRDRRGIFLPHGSGCRRLGPDELILLGDTPTSFDSRYFGPVPRSTVSGVYREVMTW